MKLGIMQPYFFPYIGYFQLINAVDTFVLFDDAQHMRHGWINRNRILKPNASWQYILVPLKKYPHKELIKNVQIQLNSKWKELIIGQLEHYKKKARYFEETNELIREILFSQNEQNIAMINFSILKKLSEYLGMNTKIIVSSEQNFDYENVSNSGEWALRIAEQMSADEYINPLDGKDLFNPEKFLSSNIRLSFLECDKIEYNQVNEFEPNLSIIDVLMFNGKAGVQSLLSHYSTRTFKNNDY